MTLKEKFIDYKSNEYSKITELELRAEVDKRMNELLLNDTLDDDAKVEARLLLEIDDYLLKQNMI